MPKKTLELMRKLGLDERTPPHQQFFRKLHHFKATASIGAHISHCETVESFTPSSRNHIVRKRLEAALEARLAGASWEDAARRALEKYPEDQPSNDSKRTRA